MTERFGASDIFVPGTIRNVLYVTLGTGDFSQGRKATGKNVEVAVTIRTPSGLDIPNSIVRGSGEQPTTAFESVIIYHSNTPTVRASRPPPPALRDGEDRPEDGRRTISHDGAKVTAVTTGTRRLPSFTRRWSRSSHPSRTPRMRTCSLSFATARPTARTRTKRRLRFRGSSCGSRYAGASAGAGAGAGARSCDAVCATRGQAARVPARTRCFGTGNTT